jgi:hypothetical protein
MEFNSVLVYQKGSLNQKPDIQSTCPAYKLSEGGTTPISGKPMLGPDHWLEVGAMKINDETLEYIDIGALDIMLLSSDQKEAIIQDAKLDEEYMQLCKAGLNAENVDRHYMLKEGLLAWKGRIYVPKANRKKVMKSEYDRKVAGYFC